MKKIPSSSSAMDTVAATFRPTFLSNIVVKAFIFCVFIICFRFAYVVTIRGESCDLGDFCFFSTFPEDTIPFTTTSSRKFDAGGNRNNILPTDNYSRGDVIQFYSSIFQDLISDGFLKRESTSLCIETPTGEEVAALREIGVLDSIGVSRKIMKPLVVSYGKEYRYPFVNSSYDFVFYGGGGEGGIDSESGVKNFAMFASEVTRIMKPEGYLVIHTKSNDTYSLNSFIDLFDSFSFIKVREIHHLLNSTPVREIVMKRELGSSQNHPLNSNNTADSVTGSVNSGGNNKGQCVVPGYKHELVKKAESLIREEPLKPWMTLKKNIQNIRYLPSMVDISFKTRYVYIDVGARSYGSSIGSWFKKQYPKQNKTFEVYAIEADKSFHEEYKVKEKKGVHLLPYAAWVKNETLRFEINHGPGEISEEKRNGKGMGRIKPVNSDGNLASREEVIQGFDFADWLKSSVEERDFVVMKMDVEGTEFDLIPKLFETGAICLVDEVFLECHYNRWQRCCPGERSGKYDKTYDQCMELFNSLRDNGVLVHQWF